MLFTISRCSLLLFVSAALLMPSMASAVPPDGAYRFEATGANQVLVLKEDADFGSAFGVPFLCGNGRRKLNGNYKRDCDLNIFGVGDEDGTVKGKFERDGDTTVIKEVLRIKGDFDVPGSGDFDFEYLLKFVATHVDGDETGTHKWKVKTCIDDHCEKSTETDEVSSAVFSNSIVASDWTLDLDVVTNAKNKIKGTATVQTDAGQTINFDVTGEYVPGDDLATIKLKNKKGAAIKIKDATVDGDIMMGTFKSKLLGNIIKFMATSVPIVP